MTQFVYQAQFTVASGVDPTAPTTQAFPLRDGILDELEIRIPRGHAGYTGLSVSYNGTQVVPFDSSSFLVGDDDKLVFPLDYEMTRKGLTLVGYNLGLLSHSFWLRAVVTPLGVNASATFAPQPALALPPTSALAGV